MKSNILVLVLGAATGALAQTEIINKGPEQQSESQQTQSEKCTQQQGAMAQSQPSRETTASVNVTTEQKTEIRQIIAETKAEPSRDINFEVNVGVTVPNTIKRLPLPPGIVKIVPRYADYEYFVPADGRIVIVDPDSLEIVLVIE
jgi:hypothetical protein